MSATRIPIRLILSAYVGPMPRPVVPIWFLPRKRSVTLSIVVWYDVIRCALLESSRREVSTPRSLSPRISFSRTAASTTTPLPMTGVTPGVRMPDGSRCSANFSPSMTMVWPALFPPWYLTQ